MKKNYFLLFFFFTVSITSQEVSSFFDGKTFELKHFIKNGNVEELILENQNDTSGNTSRGIPYLEFNFTENELEANILGYCNVTSAKYVINETNLEVVTRGGTTSSDCGGDEETEYFKPVTGNIYLQQPPEKVNYLITDDEKELWLWIDENHKLVFNEKVLSLEKNEIENAISIFPNPVNNSLHIDVKLSTLKIIEISILDLKGKELHIKTSDFSSLDLSKLSSGFYLVKIKTDKTSILKKIVKD